MTEQSERDLLDLARAAEERAQKWASAAAQKDVDPAAARLAGVLQDPNGLEFTLGFVDGVLRPESGFVAGANLAAIAPLAPHFLPPALRGAIRTGGVLAPVVPGVVVPIARRVMRQMVGHLVIDADPAKLTTRLAQLRASGSELNLNLLGEAVLGDAEATRRRDGIRALIQRDDVDYVSVKVSAIAARLSLWAFEEAVERVAADLLPLFTAAAANDTFINLDMEEYHDLDLTVAVFTRVLDRPEFARSRAGIVLQAYLPDALGAMERLQTWAAARIADGGTPIRVRLVKGANLPMERIEAEMSGWSSAPYDIKQDTDANYKRVLLWALTPERTRAVTLGVAGHNLFDVAFAHEVALDRGVTDAVEIEMLLGMAAAEVSVIQEEFGRPIRLYTPVVSVAEFDAAIGYLVRRLEEAASPENFMSVLGTIGTDEIAFERERERFAVAIRQLRAERTHLPEPRRRQNRETEWSLVDVVPEVTGALTRPAPEPDEDEAGMTQQVLDLAARRTPESPFDTTRVFDSSTIPPAPATTYGVPGFANTPNTDPALAANRAWGSRILARAAESEIGNDTLAAAAVTTPERLDEIIATVTRAGAAWGAVPAAERSELLVRAGYALAANRDRLLEVMASEGGKTLAEGDPEVSEAIDFANYYAATARELDTVRGARFVPPELIVVVSPWNFPVAIPAGGVLSALAAGAGVILKPAPQTRRSAAVLVEALWEAGIPRDLLVLADVPESRSEDVSENLGRRLITSTAVDHVILTGSSETAELFRSWNPELPLLAETSGKNAIIVMPSADLDLAVRDVVQSAFGHAGQKCSAASLVIVVGSVARSRRFHRQLLDAASSVRVGSALVPDTEMGPLIDPPSDALRYGLTELADSETWLLEPRALDDTGKLWTPGIRAGVRLGAVAHRTEFFGPSLGIMRAHSLPEAVRYVNEVGFGLTSGLHTLETDDIAEWVDTIEAGNLYVNRTITGAIVQRQPFGGWKRSVVGTGTKPGGPNYLLGLGTWRSEAGSSSSTLHLRGLDARIRGLIEAAQPSLGFEEFDLLRRGALSDAIAWGHRYGVVQDATGLAAERNLLRYRTVPVAIRATAGTGLEETLRVIAAALAAHTRPVVSLAEGLPAAVRMQLAQIEVAVSVETDAEWIESVRHQRAESPEALGRVRLLGPGREALRTALAGAFDGDISLAIYAGEVTGSGRIELLPFLREQAIAITNHRFGTVTDWTGDIESLKERD